MKTNQSLPNRDYLGEDRDTQALKPVGKMKGEIEGEVESFYIAVDREGHFLSIATLGIRRTGTRNPMDGNLSHGKNSKPMKEICVSFRARERACEYDKLNPEYA